MCCCGCCWMMPVIKAVMMLVVAFFVFFAASYAESKVLKLFGKALAATLVILVSYAIVATLYVGMPSNYCPMGQKGKMSKHGIGMKMRYQPRCQPIVENTKKGLITP